MFAYHCAGACALCVTANLSAGLIVGYADTGQTTTVYDIEVETGEATPLFGGLSVQGLAVDQGSGTLYISSPSAAGPASELYSYALNANGAAPQLIGTLPETLEGLTFANGMLYGTNSTNQFAEGFYEIDPSDATGSRILALGATTWSVQGLGYDSASGLFYGSDFDGGAGRGLFSVDLLGDQQITFLNDTFGRHGVAVNDGSVYLVRPETNEIFEYDIATDSFVGAIGSPFAGGASFAGGAYFVPTPGATCLAFVASVVLVRRRRTA